jgi:hypothetical protein
MLQGVFQRAAVAILLIGSFLAPSGICLQPMHKAAHSCCVPASDSQKAARTDCCTAHAPLLAVLVSQDVPRSASMTIPWEFAAFDEPSAPSGIAVLAVGPTLSPPTGASILRV